MAPTILILYAMNAAWLSGGLIEFCFRTRRGFAAAAQHQRKEQAQVASTAAGDEWHFDLMVYLGSMNGALALSVIYQIVRVWSGDYDVELSKLMLGIWGSVHASQAVIGWGRIFPSRRWRWNGVMGPITYIDTALWVLDWTVAMRL